MGISPAVVGYSILMWLYNYITKISVWDYVLGVSLFMTLTFFDLWTNLKCVIHCFVKCHWWDLDRFASWNPSFCQSECLWVEPKKCPWKKNYTSCWAHWLPWNGSCPMELKTHDIVAGAAFHTAILNNLPFCSRKGRFEHPRVIGYCKKSGNLPEIPQSALHGHCQAMFVFLFPDESWVADIVLKKHNTYKLFAT